MWRLVLLVSILFFAFSPTGFAQDDPEVEALYDQLDVNEAKRKAEASGGSTEPSRRKKSPEDSSKLSELAKLIPFSDVSVISLKFLPKTERFEFSGSGMLGLNNAFFNNMGLGLRGAYYFSEKHGVELSYFLLSDSQRQITEDLESKRSIETRALVVPESFMGIAYKWSPIYGKMSWLNKKIVHYDIYLAPGIGLTNTGGEDGVMTFSVSAGQTFAISKSLAFRWDFTFNQYSAKVIQKSGSTETVSELSHSDLFISFGASYYLPEVTYR